MRGVTDSMWRCVAGLWLGLLFGAAPLAAQSQAVLKPVDGQGPFDRLEQTPAVSGGTISGVMLVGRPGAPRRHLWLRCFGECVGRFQVQAKSADARWQGLGVVDSGGSPLPRNSWVRVALPMSSDPAVESIRDRLPDESIAVLARPVSAANVGTGQTRLLAGWSERADLPPSGDTVQVSLTARQLVSARAGGAPPIACRRISEREPRGFTHVCRVPLAAIERLAKPGIMVEKDEGGSIQQNAVPLG